MTVKSPLSIIFKKSYEEGLERCTHHSNPQEGGKSHSRKLQASQSDINYRKDDGVNHKGTSSRPHDGAQTVL